MEAMSRTGYQISDFRVGVCGYCGDMASALSPLSGTPGYVAKVNAGVCPKCGTTYPRNEYEFRIMDELSRNGPDGLKPRDILVLTQMNAPPFRGTIREVKPFGGAGAHVTLPKDLVGKKVRVEVID